MDDSGSGRSKRQASKQLSTRLSALDKLKKLKGGKHKYELNDVNDVYEEVDEDKYSELVINRQKEDWIVDDDGCGYAENGREIFDDEYDSDGETHNDGYKNSSDRKKKIPLKRDQQSQQSVAKQKKGDIRGYVANMGAKKLVKSLNDVEIDDNELEKFQREVFSKSNGQTSGLSCSATSTPQPLKLKKKVNYFTPKAENPFALKANGLSRNTSAGKRPNDSFNCTPKRRPLMNNSSKEVDFEAVLDSNDRKALNQLKESQSIVVDYDFNDDFDNPSEMSEQPNNSLLDGEWLASNDNVNEIQTVSIPSILSKELPFNIDKENNKCIKFYWFDAFTDYFKNPSVVYLFGKVWIKEIERHVSCCIQVRNIERRVYLLPRKYFLNDNSKKVTLQDVYNEFNDEISKKYKITQFRSRKVTKGYAFDIEDIPPETEYLEVLYSANFPALPSDLTNGKTFSHVFGVNSSGLENLMLDCNLKGPAWLCVKNPEVSDPPVSWCKLELIVNKANTQIVVDCIQNESPDFTLLSLNMRTFLHPITRTNEIIAISCLINRSFNFDKTNSSATKYDSHFCAITKPSNNSNVVLPYDFTPNMALKRYNKTKVEPMNSEREMLNYFMAKLHQLDPDIIVGHDIYHFDYDLLLSRFAHHKLAMSWSKLGRLKRSGIPNKGKDKMNLCGRLLCDIKISSKELIRAKSYDLSQLASQILRKARFEVEQQMVANYYSNSSNLLRLIDLTMKDNELILGIMYELNVLPLARQITIIAGNLLSRTLLGGRSERNEYLLLHAFHERNYICPDKVYNNSKQEVIIEDMDVMEATERKGKSKSAVGRQRKAAYTGGLVLEPKVGFYDRFILLMDFNSLYPSIIQEFNICFTTVKRSSQTDKSESEEFIPELPDSELSEGILPNEIKKLVESRREVKRLMCDPDLSSDLKQQYDIKQKALKLTANSMYGCLGFSHSRFYAKPLAALVTYKGREILMNTKQLVEKLGLEVIYGDTDSIMILTNCANFDEVKNIGYKVQSEVNRLYKLLEIDIDGVFRSMLLLKKKKYAALTVTKGANGELVYTKEVKGLDIVRRDWSILAKTAGERILDEILSIDQTSDVIVDNIHNYLKELSQTINELPEENFIINKALTKNPEDYADKKGLSHVTVALRYNELEKGKKLRNGDTVPYLICVDGTNNAATQRAYHPEVKRDHPDYTVDFKYYLSQQIHPVVSRLCDPIDGTDSHILAEFLGLETSIVRTNINRSILDSAYDRGEHKYDTCKPLIFSCVNDSCNKQIEIRQIFKKDESNEKKRLELTFAKCPHCNIEFNDLMIPQFVVQLKLLINSFIRQFYQKWMICEDKSCSHRTRYFSGQLSKEGLKCSKCGLNFLYPEISDVQLYHQLTFYKYLLDLDAVLKKISSEEEKASAAILKAKFSIIYSKLRQVVQTFLNASAYNEVDLNYLFKKFRPKILRKDNY